MVDLRASRPRSRSSILNRATRYYLAALAVAIGFRMNLFNIGVDGQYRLAAIFAAAVGGGGRRCPAPLHIAADHRRRDGGRRRSGPAIAAC